MPIVELYESPYKGEVDVYRYDYLPKPLRVQVCFLMQDFGDWQLGGRGINEYIVDALCREYGAFNLEELDIYSVDENKNSPDTLVLQRPAGSGYKHPDKELKNFFLCRKEIKHDLNAIKLAFDFMKMCAHASRTRTYISRSFSLAIEELNTRFKQHGIGYEFRNNNFLRIDSQFVHGKIVKPALNLLTDRDYSRAQEEFMAAHGHHLNGNAVGALNECNKSLESVLKIICAKRKWQYNPSDGFGKLLEKVTEKGLIPKHWNTLFPALTNLLAGAPRARNELSGHGRGSQEAISIPPHVAAYAMHMTAAAILFLVEAEKDIQTP